MFFGSRNRLKPVSFKSGQYWPSYGAKKVKIDQKESDPSFPMFFGSRNRLKQVLFKSDSTVGSEIVYRANHRDGSIGSRPDDDVSRKR